MNLYPNHHPLLRVHAANVAPVICVFALRPRPNLVNKDYDVNLTRIRSSQLIINLTGATCLGPRLAQSSKMNNIVAKPETYKAMNNVGKLKYDLIWLSTHLKVLGQTPLF